MPEFKSSDNLRLWYEDQGDGEFPGLKTVVELQRFSEFGLAGVAYDGTVCVWDVRKRKLNKRVNVSSAQAGQQVNPAFVHQVARFSDSAVLLATGDGCASIFDTKAHSLHSFPGGHVGPATSVCRMSDTMFVSGGDDDRVALWDTRKEAPLLWWWAKETRVNCCAADEQQLRVLVGGPGGASRRRRRWGGDPRPRSGRRRPRSPGARCDGPGGRRSPGGGCRAACAPAGPGSWFAARHTPS